MPVVFLRRPTIISKDGVTTVLTEYKIKKMLKKKEEIGDLVQVRGLLGDWRQETHIKKTKDPSFFFLLLYLASQIASESSSNRGGTVFFFFHLTGSKGGGLEVVVK